MAHLMSQPPSRSKQDVQHSSRHTVTMKNQIVQVAWLDDFLPQAISILQCYFLTKKNSDSMTMDISVLQHVLLPLFVIQM